MVQARVAPLPGWVAMPRVIEAAELVTTLPPTSSTVTTGWVAQTAPSTPPPGWALKTSWEAAPIVMLKALLVAPVRPMALAVSV